MKSTQVISVVIPNIRAKPLTKKQNKIGKLDYQNYLELMIIVKFIDIHTNCHVKATMIMLWLFLGTANYTINPCPAGYYCDGGTASDTENPCPAGTYNNVTEATSDSYCLSCPGGMYCDNQVSGHVIRS